MASKNTQDYLDAADKAPSERTDAEKALVSEAYSKGMTNVKNADHATKNRVKTYGS